MHDDETACLRAAVGRMAATEWEDRVFRADVRCGGTSYDLMSDRAGDTRSESRFMPEPGPEDAPWVVQTVRLTARSTTDWKLNTSTATWPDWRPSPTPSLRYGARTPRVVVEHDLDGHVRPQARRDVPSGDAGVVADRGPGRAG